ncbi:MAG: AMP-binding protein [Gammaproteobacteria bacterium]|nr:AMP-binding protein [Gammaproteobacteria bacterium]
MNDKYRSHSVIREDRADGRIILRAKDALPATVDRTTDWLDKWAGQTPSAVFLAQRSGEGWLEVSYLEAQQRAKTLAAGLLDLGLTSETPIMILSGNSVDHGILAMVAQYVGIPIVPLPEQYSLVPAARNQVDYAVSVVNPGLVYAEDGEAFADVLDRDVFQKVHKVVSKGGRADIKTIEQLSQSKTNISQANSAVGPDSIAKILMTSGSTSSPKAVPTSHGMMCVNMAQVGYGLPFLAERPPVIVDWLPWNHVFGGSHNFNMMLANGGALYIDAGKPAPHLIGLTLENLRLKTGTMVFNVPAGFAMIRDALKQDTDLQHAYFDGLDMLFYAGASLPQDVWSDLETMAREVRGDMPLFTSSWGLTETAPAVLLQHQPTTQSGVIGIPLPGIDVKLIPEEDKRYEVRVRGPNVFKRYLNQPDQSKDAFDEEGFFKTGDAMQFVDENNMNLGLKFSGRISEEFKLLTGTWVRAATLRLDVLVALGGIASDVVLTGADRNDIGVFVIPTGNIRESSDANELEGALSIKSIESDIRKRLETIGSSSSTRIARAMILSEAPSMALGEITAKGNINFRKLLECRTALLDRLYHDKDEATILINE